MISWFQSLPFKFDLYRYLEAGKSRWCDTGVYATIRHPNFLGELMFWFGNFLAGLPAMTACGIWPIIPAGIGLSFIHFLMNKQATVGLYNSSSVYP